jgi:hypothetical protein
VLADFFGLVKLADNPNSGRLSPCHTSLVVIGVTGTPSTSSHALIHNSLAKMVGVSQALLRILDHHGKPLQFNQRPFRLASPV